MLIITGGVPSLLGLGVGLLPPLLIGFWLLSPPDNPVRRGYINAVAVGILLGAALEFIPTTLTELEFTGYRLFEAYIVSAINPEPGSMLWVFTRSTPFQVVVRSLAMIGVMFLFFRGNAAAPAIGPETSLESDRLPPRQSAWQTWLALPAAAQLDRAGLTIVTLGLFCYNLWLGALRAPVPDFEPGPKFLALMLLPFSGAVLGIAILGLLPDLGQHWPWLVGLSALLGLAMILGFATPGGQIALQGAPFLLLLGTVCLIYSIGRLLRILQDQIGLRWPTTLTVAASAGLLYLTSPFISAMI